FTTGFAARNISPMFSLPLPWIWGGSLASAAAGAAAGAAAPAGAAAGAEAAAGAAAGAAFCANAGALTASAVAPRRAMRGVFSLLSNICRQFLVGLARLAGGSSRESVSTLVETIPAPIPDFSGLDPGPLSLRRDPQRVPSQSRKAGVSNSRGDLGRPEGPQSLTAMLDMRRGTFGNPHFWRQGAVHLSCGW